MKKIKQTTIILLNIIIFVILNSFAFAISPVFGLLFVLSFVISIYNKEIKKKPWKTFVIFVGGLITRFALGQIVTTLPNYELTLDFVISAIILFFMFVLGWKIKRK